MQNALAAVSLFFLRKGRIKAVFSIFIKHARIEKNLGKERNNMLTTEDFDFELPEELIAQTPSDRSVPVY